MFKSNKLWGFIGAFVLIFLLYYSFFYSPNVPTASINIENKSYELKAKDYDYSAFGKGTTKNFYFKSVNELNTHLQNEPELIVQSNHPITYKNNASTDATNVSIYNVDENVYLRGETESTVQTITKPGHYIIQYLSEFETGKIATYYVRIRVVNYYKNY